MGWIDKGATNVARGYSHFSCSSTDALTVTRATAYFLFSDEDAGTYFTGAHVAALVVLAEPS